MKAEIILRRYVLDPVQPLRWEFLTYALDDGRGIDLQEGPAAGHAGRDLRVESVKPPYDEIEPRSLLVGVIHR